MVGIYLTSMSNNIHSAMEEICSPALSDTIHLGVVLNTSCILVKNVWITPNVSDRRTSGLTYEYLEYISINVIKYSLNAAGIPGMLSSPIISVLTSSPFS